MARARRKDANQSEIERVFKDAGCSVLDMSRLGDGVPDLLIGTPQGACFLVEVKTKNGKITEKQAKFAWGWKTQVFLVKCVEDAEELAYVLTFSDTFGELIH